MITEGEVIELFNAVDEARRFALDGVTAFDHLTRICREGLKPGQAVDFMAVSMENAKASRNVAQRLSKALEGLSRERATAAARYPTAATSFDPAMDWSKPSLPLPTEKATDPRAATPGATSRPPPLDRDAQRRIIEQEMRKALEGDRFSYGPPPAWQDFIPRPSAPRPTAPPPPLSVDPKMLKRATVKARCEKAAASAKASKFPFNNGGVKPTPPTLPRVGLIDSILASY